MVHSADHRNFQHISFKINHFCRFSRPLVDWADQFHLFFVNLMILFFFFFTINLIWNWDTFLSWYIFSFFLCIVMFWMCSGIYLRRCVCRYFTHKFDFWEKGSAGLIWTKYQEHETVHKKRDQYLGSCQNIFDDWPPSDLSKNEGLGF